MGTRHRFALIWTLAVLILVVLAALVAKRRAEDQDARIQATGASIGLLAQSATAALNRSLLSVDLLLAAQAREVQKLLPDATTVDASALRGRWRELLDQHVLVRDLVLLDAGGRIVTAVQDATLRLGLPLPPGFVDEVRAQQIASVRASAPVLDEASGEPALWLARALPGPQPKRVLLAQVPVSALASLFAQGTVLGRWSVTIERDDGTLLAAVPASDALLGQRLAKPLQAGTDGRARLAESRLGGGPALLAVHPSLYPSVLLSVGASTKELLAESNEDFVGDVSWAALAALFVLGLAAVLHWHLRTEVQARERLAAGHAELVAQVQAREAADAGRLKAQQMMDRMLQRTHEGYWQIDLEGRSVEVNPAMCALLGRPREAVLGHTIFEFVDATNAEIFRRQIALRDQGRAGSYEVTLQRPDGVLVQCINNATPLHDEQGQRIGSVGQWTDISALKRTQAELASARATLDEALDAMSDGFVVFDAEDRLVAWNRRYVEMFPYLDGRIAVGMSLAEVGDMATRALMPGASDDERRALVARRRAERQRGSGVSGITVQPGLVVEAIDRRTADGKQVSLFRDVTQARNAAAAMAQARDAAEAAALAKSRFLATMSHEIRTPLNAVLGMNGLLADTALSSEQRRYVDLIAKSGESLLAIINDILDLSRLEAGKLTLEVVDFSLAGALHDVVSMMSARAQGKGLALQWQPVDEPLHVRGDPSRLRQVLFNLIGNAIKFTEHGEVTVRLQQHDSTAGRVAVRIDVADTGIGIAPEALAQLFEPFAQADGGIARRFGGTGLGLSICRDLVRLMGGHIGVQSSLGAGSVFSVTLDLERADSPAAESPAGASAGAAALPAAARATGAAGAVPAPAQAAVTGLRILVAEDNSINQMLIRAVLATLGHHPDIVGDGVEALRQVQAVPYDLVLMDVQMPQMDGIAATRAIRALDAACSRVPIVAMTANVLSEDRQACLDAGMDAFVGKPIDRVRLQQTLASLAAGPVVPAESRRPGSARALA